MENTSPAWVLHELMQVIPSDQQFLRHLLLFCARAERRVKEVGKLISVNTKLAKCTEGLLVNWLGF